jgi:AraC family transcriptional regulator
MRLNASSILGENCAVDVQVPIFKDIASGKGWRLRDVVCHARAGQAAFEEVHDHHVIAALKSGMFSYQGRHGRTLLHPGSLLVGNSGYCYCCRHDHGDGDHCMALQIDHDLYAEIASTSAARMTFEFSSARLPLQRDVFASLVALNAALEQKDAIHTEEAILQYVEVVLHTASQSSPVKQAHHFNSAKIAAVIAYIEARAAEPLTLQGLADWAGLSRYHFLRVFKHAAGMTPYQFILLARIKLAVRLLTTTKLPIIDIGLSPGFGDLSTFNRTFKAQTGKTPRAFRN